MLSRNVRDVNIVALQTTSREEFRGVSSALTRKHQRGIINSRVIDPSPISRIKLRLRITYTKWIHNTIRHTSFPLDHISILTVRQAVAFDLVSVPFAARKRSP